MSKVELDREVALGIVNYLAGRPYGEVYQVIPVLTQAIADASGGDFDEDALLQADDEELDEEPETS